MSRPGDIGKAPSRVTGEPEKNPGSNLEGAHGSAGPGHSLLAPLKLLAAATCHCVLSLKQTAKDHQTRGDSPAVEKTKRNTERKEMGAFRYVCTEKREYRGHRGGDAQRTEVTENEKCRCRNRAVCRDWRIQLRRQLKK